MEPTFRQSPRRTTPLAILGIAVLASILLFALNSIVDRGHQIQTQLTATRARAFELAALEWKMIAEESVSAETEQSMAELHDTLRQFFDQTLALGGNSAELQTAHDALHEYLEAMDEETQLIKSGDLAGAKLVDEERVDPSFEKMDNALEAADSSFNQRVATARLAVNILSILLLLGSGALVANLLARNEQARTETMQASIEKDTLVQAAKHNEELTRYSTALDRRNTYLSAASRVARETASSRDLGTLLDSITRLIQNQFGFYHAGIFLTDENNDYVVLVAASSEGGQRMLARGHKLRVEEEGIVGFAAAQKRPRIALDTGTDAAYFDNPDLPATRSEVALPLIAHGKTIGVLDIQSENPQAFTPEDVDILQTLADQLTLAIENARLFSDMETIVQQLEQTAVKRTYESWSELSKQRSPVYQYTPLGVQMVGAAPEPRQDTGTLVIPIVLRGRNIGRIHLKRKGGATGWLEQEQSMVQEVAAQVGLALENARLLEDAQTRAARERSIGEMSARIGSTFDVDSILRTTAQEIGKALGDAEVQVRLRGGEETTSVKLREGGDRRNKR